MEMGTGTGMGMVDRKWEGNGNSSLEEIPVRQRTTVDAVESKRFASLPHTVCGWPASVVLTCLLIYFHNK